MKFKNIKNKFKINHRSLFNIAVIAILSIGLVSCIDEKIIEEPKNNNEKPSIDNKIYLAINISLPTQTESRSSTEPDGTSDENPDNEEGKANENAVNRAIFYFYEDNSDDDSKDDTYIGMFAAYKTGTPNNGIYTVRTEIDSEDLLKLAGKKLKLYVGANYTTHVFPTSGTLYTPTVTPSEWDPINAYINLGGNAEDAPLGYYGTNEEGKELPLANKDVYKIDLTDLSDSSKDNIITKLQELIGEGETTLNISTQKKKNSDDQYIGNGNLELERCVARVDYKPAKGEGIDIENLYHVGVVENLYAKITEMQVINLRKNTNLFRHTVPGNETKASLGTSSSTYNKVTLFDTENKNPNFGDNEAAEGTDINSYRWVADVALDWGRKLEWSSSSYNGNVPFYNDYFHNQPTKGNNDPLYFVHPTVEGKLYSNITIENLKKGYKGNDDDYYRWCYIPENTLPSIDAMIKGLSTGIAFKMILCDKEGSPLTSDKFILKASYNQYLAELEKWEKKRDEWLADKEGKNEEDFIKTENSNKPIDPSEGGKVIIEEELKRFSYKDLVEEGEGDNKQTVEKTIETNYYLLKIGNQECYVEAKYDEENKFLGYEVIYYYFFRHNYSGDNHILGNVEPMQYAVVRNNIYKISVKSLNSLPVPYDPKDPDEPQNLYMSVELKVLAWARRDITVTW